MVAGSSALAPRKDTHMDNNQSLAKIGVLLLLAGNVGAYCYFWPKYRDAVNTPAKTAGQEKGEAQLMATKAPAEPKLILPEPKAVPLAISNPPALPAERNVRVELRVSSEHPADASFKLVEHIDNDKSPELPVLPTRESANREAPARIEPPNVMPRDPDPGIAVASPPAPKMPPGVWQIQSENSGNHTHLTARLRDAAGERVVAEFRIRCDRIESNPQTGQVQALGNVRFNGAGWRGTCRSVTLPVHEPRLVFEGEIHVSQDVLGSSQDGGLRGERIVWELPATPTAVLERHPTNIDRFRLSGDKCYGTQGGTGP